MRKLYYYGAAAIMVVLGAAVSVSSCNDDDEYYDASAYTLAKKHVTRAIEGTESTPGVGEVLPGSYAGSVDIGAGVTANYELSCEKGSVEDLKGKVKWTIQNNSNELEYTDSDGNRKKIKEYVKVKVTGCTSANICSLSFYNPNGLISYDKAIMDSGTGEYVYKHMEKCFVLDYPIPSNYLIKY